MKLILEKAIKAIIKSRNIIVFLCIPVLSGYMHYNFFKFDLQGAHAWRQTETQTVISNFSEKDMNILNPRVNNHGNENDIYRLEFPLMQWIYAIFFKIFGDHIIMSRLLTFIVGLFCVFGFYRLAFSITNDYLSSIVGAWIFNFCPTFYFYTINPMPDVFALCLTIWGLFFFFRWVKAGNNTWFYSCLAFFGLATLVKIPFIVSYSLIGAVIILKIFKSKKIATFNIQKTILLTFISIIPAILWYAWVIPTWEKSGTITGIFKLKPEQIRELPDIFTFIITNTLPFYLINIFALPLLMAGLFFAFVQKSFRHHLFFIMAIWATGLLLYYIFEVYTIGKYHDYYFFPFLPFIFILVLFGIKKIFDTRKTIPILAAFILIGRIPGQAPKYSDWRWFLDSKEMNADYIYCKKALRSAVPDNALVIVANDITPCIDLYYIHKKGWVVDNYWLPEDTLIKRIHSGARYFYCDTRKIDAYEKIAPHLGKKIMQCNSINVWELKKVDKE